MATVSQVRQQQLSKLKAELANLKKQQSLAKQQSEGGLVKKPNLKSTEGKDLLAKYNDGDWILASFYTLKECQEKGDEMVCMLYHENKGWVKVFGIQ